MSIKQYLTILLIVLTSTLFSQWQCYSRIDSVFQVNNSAGMEVYRELSSVDCESRELALYFLGQKYFFQDNVDSLESTSKNFIESIDFETSKDYLSRRNAGFLCLLLAEEYRWRKNKTQFEQWVSKFRQVISFYKCGNSLHGLYNKAQVSFRQKLMKFNGSTALKEYENRRKKRLKKKFLRKGYSRYLTFK